MRITEVFIHGFWTGVGGNFPWGEIGGYIADINLIERGQLEFTMTDGSIVDIRSDDYVVVRKPVK